MFQNKIEEYDTVRGALLQLAWIPVQTQSPHPLLPWKEDLKKLEAPSQVSSREHMWYE